MKYYLIAGEASGDLHASNLMKAIREKDENATFRFFGGDCMAAVGGEPVKHYREMAYMGFMPVLLHARVILRSLRLCKEDIVAWQPDLLILVDYAGFNLKIAAFIKKNHPSIPIHYYISPKIWAWKTYRIRYFKRDVDKMYIVFPFEKDFFAKHDYPATYVGNPSVDSVEAFRALPFDEAAWRKKCGLSADKPILALLSGSRKQEVTRNLPTMLRVAALYQDRFQVVVSGGPGLDASFYQKMLSEYNFPLLFGETYSLLSAAHTALVVSGTATLETALFDVPQVVCYNMFGGPILTKLIRRYFIRTPFISLVNLVAGQEVVKELISYQYTYDILSEELKKIIEDSPNRIAMKQAYTDIHRLLGEPGTAQRAASLITDFLKNKH